MKDHRQAFREYFKDFYKWIALTIIALIAFYLLVLIGFTNVARGRYWVVPAAFVVILLVHIRFFILYFKALNDLKKGRVEKKTVAISEIGYDYRYTFRRLSGYNKIKITDSEGEEFHTVFTDEGIKPGKEIDLKGAKAEIEYLALSKIILTQKVIS
ncbi:MAG: hypothetical protein IJS94_05080 [Clostridia bacterium]|nr:hypothetical protein [Clostridia bacterium]